MQPSSFFINQQDPCRQINAKRSRILDQLDYTEPEVVKVRKSLTQQAPTLLGTSFANERVPQTESVENSPEKQDNGFSNIFGSQTLLGIPERPNLFLKKSTHQAISHQYDRYGKSKLTSYKDISQPNQDQSSLKLSSLTSKFHGKKSSIRLSQHVVDQSKTQFTLTSLRWRMNKIFQGSAKMNSPQNSKKLPQTIFKEYSNQNEDDLKQQDLFFRTHEEGAHEHLEESSEDENQESEDQNQEDVEYDQQGRDTDISKTTLLSQPVIHQPHDLPTSVSKNSYYPQQMDYKDAGLTCAISCISTTASTGSLFNNRKSRRRRTSTLKDLDSHSQSIYDGNKAHTCDNSHLYSQALLKKEHILLHSTLEKKSLLELDFAGYGHFWYIFQRQREHLFQPWQLTLTGKIEKLRLSVTAMYWESLKYHPISLSTIYVAISNFNRLLSAWPLAELEHPSPAQWALTAVVAYRLAFKVEERPEILWDVNNFWDIFPIFSEWSIDRSHSNMNKVEMAALESLNDMMDIPSAPLFLSLFLSAGGWPAAVAKEYRELAMYILGVVTFASVKDHLLKNIVPSTIAVAALILAIKIVNGDRHSPCGILPHLPECPRQQKEANVDVNQCICRYEFFPDRLKAYCDMQLSEILPVIRGISNLLRSKPEETYALRYSFPLWGEHDWR